MEFVEESEDVSDAESSKMNNEEAKEQRGWCPFMTVQ